MFSDLLNRFFPMFSDLLNRFFPEDSHFTCTICTESLPTEKRFLKKRCFFFSNPSYCTECIARYIKVEVKDNRKSAVKCPSPTCKNLLDPLSCRPILTPDTFAVWCDNLAKNLIRRLAPSYCPNPRCLEPVVSDCNDFVTRTECPGCKEEFCFKCSRWNGGCRCGGQRMDENYLSFIELAMNKGWKRCPDCRACVARRSGCKWIICRCGSSFIYE